MSGYTPTTDEAREAVAEWMWSRRMWRKELELADGMEFDRTAAEMKADAWDEGYQEANSDLWREGGREGNPYRAEAYRQERGEHGSDS